MLPQCAPAPQTPRRIGIDTSRYGHYAAFLKDDLQPAVDVLDFAESAADYALLHQRLQAIRQRYDVVHFALRLDVAGPGHPRPQGRARSHRWRAERAGNLRADSTNSNCVPLNGIVPKANKTLPEEAAIPNWHARPQDELASLRRLE